MTLAEPIIRRWTKTEYMRLAEYGCFAGQRVNSFEGRSCKCRRKVSRIRKQ